MLTICVSVRTSKIGWTITLQVPWFQVLGEARWRTLWKLSDAGSLTGQLTTSEIRCPNAGAYTEVLPACDF